MKYKNNTKQEYEHHMEELWSFPQMAPWQLAIHIWKKVKRSLTHIKITSDQDLNQTKKLGKFALVGTKQATKTMNKFVLAGNCFEWD